MDNSEIGLVVGGLICGGIGCIGLAVVILIAVVAFWTSSQRRAEPEPRPPMKPLPSSQKPTVMMEAHEPLPEPAPEPDPLDDDAMETVVSPPSVSLPSAPPPPSEPPPPRKSSGPTIITFDEEDDD